MFHTLTLCALQRVFTMKNLTVKHSMVSEEVWLAMLLSVRANYEGNPPYLKFNVIYRIFLKKTRVTGAID